MGMKKLSGFNMINTPSIVMATLLILLLQLVIPREYARSHTGHSHTSDSSEEKTKQNSSDLNQNKKIEHLEPELIEKNDQSKENSNQKSDKLLEDNIIDLEKKSLNKTISIWQEIIFFLLLINPFFLYIIKRQFILKTNNKNR